MLNDCDTNAVVAARPQPVSGGGRTKGQSNFRADEDQKLARAYALVSTDAAVGTDQDCCETFWKKIHVNFIKRGGGVERTPNSLQNRFNKVLQCDVLKYIGFFQSSLREYHSGWQMADYVEEAKKQFQFKMKKAFKYDAVYEILKKARLPKYELELSSVNRWCLWGFYPSCPSFPRAHHSNIRDSTRNCPLTGLDLVTGRYPS